MTEDATMTTTPDQPTDSSPLTPGAAGAGRPADRRSPLVQRALEGVRLCRAGRWKEGHGLLKAVAEGIESGGGSMPSEFYSYLGYTLAWRDGRWKEGLELCRRAVGLEVFQAENQVNLARVHLLRQQRRRAVACLRRALLVDPGNAAALRLWERMGRRRRPVLSWLDRDHALNRVLGQIRHDLFG